MNTIFGIWRPKGPPVSKMELQELATNTVRFSSDGEFMSITSQIGMGIQTWHTHLRSRLENQPLSDLLGNLLVYDGRLDNYQELLGLLKQKDDTLGDPEIILSAYRRWGIDCFEKFVGDWALALWDSTKRALFLGRDHAGTRTLYYSRNSSGDVVWSTYLDSFHNTHLLDTVDSRYIATYLGMVPNYERTPYRDVRAVLPGHVLQISEIGSLSKQFWTPLIHDELILKSDRDYDEQFLDLLGQAVARRTGPGAPVLAQLSGGMDSTSIVCVSDRLQKLASNGAGLVDTISYFDDSDPSWNDKPYFSIIEARRGKPGIHLDSSRYRASIDRSVSDGAFYVFPGTSRTDLRRDADLASIVAGRYRVMIAGVGGDELTGGVVEPAAELADYIATGRFATAIRRTTSWCLARRSSFFVLFARSLRYMPEQMTLAGLERMVSSIPWLTKSSRDECCAAIQELPMPVYRPFATRPSHVGACRDWWYTLRTQPHLRPSEIYRFEYRYPYFDRDLVEFLLRVPQRQLAAPGRRRLMMRRALKGIVPEEILERKRKAFLLQGRLSQLSELAPALQELISDSTLADLGFVDMSALRSALDKTTTGQDIRWWGLILRYAHLETWLKYHASRQVWEHCTEVSAERGMAASAGTVPAT